MNLCKYLAILLCSGFLSVSHGSELYKVQTEHGTDWVYLKESGVPVGLPNKVFPTRTFVSSDENTIVLILDSDKPRGGYFYGLLVAHRNSPKSAWRVSYELLSCDLFLRFGKQAWVSDVKSLDEFPKVELEIAYDAYRLPPSKVLREVQTWNLSLGDPEIAIEIDPSTLDLGVVDPWQTMTVEKYRKRMRDEEASDEEIQADIDRYKPQSTTSRR